MKRSAMVVAAIVMLGASAWPAGSSIGAATSSAWSGTRMCEWKVVPTPGGAGSARGAALGPQGQILAVGDGLTDHGVVGRSMRWDGYTWTRVPVPPAAGADVYLTDVAFMGDATSIAVGTRVAESELPYSLWWDGVAWTEPPMPAIEGSGWLTSVAHVPGTSRAWAVGWRDGPGPAFNPQPLIMRWRSGGWHVVLSTFPLRDEALMGVASTGAVTWAVGATAYGSPSERTLTLRHREGEGWRVVPSPHPGRFQELVAVSARRSTDVIAVGRRSRGSTGTRGMLIRWDGGRWRTLDAERVPGLERARELRDVAHGPDGTLWVLGTRVRAIGPDPDYAWHPPLVLRRSGGHWITTAVPRVARAVLEAAVVAGPGDVWALGAVQAEDGSTPLAYHRCS